MNASGQNNDHLKEAIQRQFQQFLSRGYSRNEAAAAALTHVWANERGGPSSGGGQSTSSSAESNLASTQEEDKADGREDNDVSMENAEPSAAAAASSGSVPTTVETTSPSKADTGKSSVTSKRTREDGDDEKEEGPLEAENFQYTEKKSKDHPVVKKDDILTVSGIENLLDSCSQQGQYTELTRTIGKTLRSPVLLNHSFLREDVYHAAEGSYPGICNASPDDSGIDADRLHKALTRIYELNHEGPRNALAHAYEAAFQEQLLWLDNPQMALRDAGVYPLSDAVQLRQFLVVALDPQCMDPDSHFALKYLYRLADKVQPQARSVLSTWFSYLSEDTLQYIVQCTQQFITLRLCQGNVAVNEIRPSVTWLALLHDANEMLYKRTGRRAVSYDEFYNDVVSTEVNLEDDFKKWLKARRDGTNSSQVFCFCNYSFILDAGAKSAILTLDSRYQMAREYRETFLSGLARGMLEVPYYELKIRRDHLVEDALEQVTRTSDKTVMKRPLRVTFIGEPGLDEGGVRKEFFLLMVRQVFSPAFGMFKEDPDTKLIWFNPDAFDAGASKIQFELIGSLIGLAIYNSIILDVNFPLILYKKLKNEPPTLRDMEEFKPDVGRSLRKLLEYDGGDDEDIFSLNFTASYETIWGDVKTVDLVENGADTPVTVDNKDNYVKRYVQWVLEDNIAPMFDAFKTGFLNVAGGPAFDLFRPEELQLLVIGSGDLDFEDLERTTSYEEPYHRNHDVINNFWTCVHSLSPEEKRQFLSFVTGSDRAPIRGLGTLELTISRAGPDSSQLPTAHTCFNHILLPEYPTYEKLESKLKAAIKESHGFGLI
eukprot:gb/GECG01016661.1/.p1 GENE.gb/GECG01016661.1/~~gb/GECG01016661.1/.p1  ORF type:complete len:826 (+),score=108.45 gb/GECG01016661.1/:1-2478(+)